MKPITPEQKKMFSTYLIYQGTRPCSDYQGRTGRFWSLRDVAKKVIRLYKPEGAR